MGINLGFLPNMSLEDAINREIEAGQVKRDRSGSTNYNWQDKFGGFLGGYSQSDVNAGIKRKEDEKLKEKLTEEYSNTLSRLGILAPSYTGVQDGKTATELRQLIADDKYRAVLLEKLRLTKGQDKIEVDPKATSSQLLGYIQQAQKNYESEPGSPREVILHNRRIAEQDRNDLLREQIRQGDIQLKQLANQNAASIRSNQLEGRRLDLQETRLNMEDSRERRNDQQLALMTIMKGLAQMGSSITA